MCKVIEDGKYTAVPGAIESLDAKRPEFTEEKYKEWIKDKLREYDHTPGSLAGKAYYVFRCTGIRYEKLRSIAEEVRKDFFWQKAKQF